MYDSIASTEIITSVSRDMEGEGEKDDCRDEDGIHDDEGNRAQENNTPRYEDGDVEEEQREDQEETTLQLRLNGGEAEAREEISSRGSKLVASLASKEKSQLEKGPCKSCISCAFKTLYMLNMHAASYTSLYVAYKCAMTLSCTQVSCERVFSKLKIVKSRLRARISQPNLESLIIISSEEKNFFLDKDESIDLQTLPNS